MKPLFRCLVTLCLFSTFLSIKDSILQNIEEQETLVSRLAAHCTSLYSSRYEEIPDCTCSTHICSNIPVGTECHSELGVTPDICPQTCPGQRLNYNSSVVSIPPSSNATDLSNELKESICTFRRLQDFMHESYPKDFHFTYVATTDGHSRIWPAIGREHNQVEADDVFNGCKLNDPRQRPWYIAASTGSKDIIIVIDGSGSMIEDQVGDGLRLKWDIVKTAVFSMLDTLSTGDFVNIVIFSDSARQLWKTSSLAAATSDNKKRMKALLDYEVPSGGTNFDAAFQLAFKLLVDGCSQDKCSLCQHVILFLTDGKDTSFGFDGGIKPSNMSKRIESYQAELKKATSQHADIFTISMGIDADDSIPRQIACNNHGSWSFIGEGDDPLTALSSYYRFLTAARKSSRPVWSEPYIDALGAGRLTTVSAPFFSEATEKFDSVFLGVVGHDVFLSNFGDSEEEIESVIHELVDRSSYCSAVQVDPCQLQVLRYVYANKATCVDRFPIREINAEEEEKPDCFTNGFSYYKRYSKVSTWTEARDVCREDNGDLVSVGTQKELAFIANMAHDDGSWIGARKKLDKYMWLDKEYQPIDVHSDFWGIGQPAEIETVDACVSVDTRGSTGNMNTKSCESRLTFICEYDSDESCSEEIRDPLREPDQYFTVPPVYQCIDSETYTSNLSQRKRVENLTSADLFCPMGDVSNDVNLRCCDQCGGRVSTSSATENLELSYESMVDADGTSGKGVASPLVTLVLLLSSLIGILSFVIGVLLWRIRRLRDTSNTTESHSSLESDPPHATSESASEFRFTPRLQYHDERAHARLESLDMDI